MDIKSTTSTEASGVTAGEVVTIVPDADDTFIGYTASVVDFMHSAPWENIVSVLGNEDVVIRIKAFKRGTPIKEEVAEQPEPTGEGVDVAVTGEDKPAVEQEPEVPNQDEAQNFAAQTVLESALEGRTFEKYEHAVKFYSAIKQAVDLIGLTHEKVLLTLMSDRGGYTVKLSPATPGLAAPVSAFLRQVSNIFNW